MQFIINALNTLNWTFTLFVKKFLDEKFVYFTFPLITESLISLQKTFLVYFSMFFGTIYAFVNSCFNRGGVLDYVNDLMYNLY